MAVTIDATVGGAASNSFVTLAEAATFMEGRLNASTWETDATTDNKNRALVEATRFLSSKPWVGSRTDGTQILSWPRQWALDPDSPIQDYYDTDVIPQRIKDATMELAFQFIKAGTTDVAALDSKRNVRRSRVDVLETEYFSPNSSARGLALYPSVLRYIAPLLDVVSAGRTVQT